MTRFRASLQSNARRSRLRDNPESRPTVAELMAIDHPVPSPLGGIRNSAHLAPFVLWRGEQPADDDTADALRRAGIDVVLSLRMDGEPANRQLPECSVSDERSRWPGHGFGFRHIQMTDFAAPHPAELAEALRTIDREIDAGRTVYVHWEPRNW